MGAHKLDDQPPVQPHEPPPTGMVLYLRDYLEMLEKTNHRYKNTLKHKQAYDAFMHQHGKLRHMWDCHEQGICDRCGISLVKTTEDDDGPDRPPWFRRRK